MGRKLETDAEIIHEGRKFFQQGLEIIMVSMGARGLLVFDEKAAFKVVPPQIEVKSTIGSGDSAFAAFLLGLEQGKSLAECGIMAAAAGAATAMSPGVELVNADDFAQLMPLVKCEELN